MSKTLSLSPKKMNASNTVTIGDKLFTTPMIVRGMYLLENEFMTCVKVLLKVLNMRKGQSYLFTLSYIIFLKLTLMSISRMIKPQKERIMRLISGLNYGWLSKSNFAKTSEQQELKIENTQKKAPSLGFSGFLRVGILLVITGVESTIQFGDIICSLPVWVGDISC